MHKGITRRQAVFATAAALCGPARSAEGLDRKKIVERHSPVLTAPDFSSALQVGNGEFAFAADITGLQTFSDEYQKGMPLGTMAQWAWHSVPNSGDYRLSEAMKQYDSYGRSVSYPVGINEFGRAAASVPERVVNAATWLRANPQRIHLARIALELPQIAGETSALHSLTGIRQKLDLWNGCIDSRFELLSSQVHVETACHPQRDLLGIRITSPLLSDGRLGLLIAFPGASTSWMLGYDWNSPASYRTEVVKDDHGAIFECILDATTYWSKASWSPGGSLRETQPHQFHLSSEGRDQLELVIEFSPARPAQSLVSVSQVFSAASEYWPRFWGTGGAIDFSECTDSRASELERRVVLSQYLTAVNCAGSMPPQETGLVTNSWFGKSHLEMHWWHAAHFVLWGRPALLERSLPWYRKILPRAQETARQQGYRGARWPKEIGPEGRETPSDIGVFLVWQQPHPIYYSELLYRLHPSRTTLNAHREIVFETAEFMASYAAWEDSKRRYVLGPPLIPAQESYQKICARVINPTFELAYWHWGLFAAQRWRERLGLERKPSWDKVMNHLSPSPVRNGIYTAIEVEPYTVYDDHPSMLCALGMLPKTPLIDLETMGRTLDDVLARWNWKTSWGWDYPVMAMTAARLGQPRKAVDALLMEAPKNVYLPDGLNLGQPGILPLYLPGNGGLLYAIATMAAGWDGSNESAPGFPKDGTWNVKWEGLRQAL
jgi:hypothetical protein